MEKHRIENGLLSYFSQVIYCGGYSGGEPPLPIPNREVKPAIADGTAPPGGRVGSCRSSGTRLTLSAGFFCLCSASARKSQNVSCLRPSTLPTPVPSSRGPFFGTPFREIWTESFFYCLARTGSAWLTCKTLCLSRRKSMYL